MEHMDQDICSHSDSVDWETKSMSETRYSPSCLSPLLLHGDGTCAMTSTTERRGEELPDFTFPHEQCQAFSTVKNNDPAKSAISGYASYLLMIYINHCNLRRLIIRLTLIFYEAESRSEHHIARMLFSSWLQQHRPLLEKPYLQQSPPQDLVEQLFQSANYADLPDRKETPKLPNDKEYDSMTVEGMASLFTQAQDAQERVLKAMGALNSLILSDFLESARTSLSLGSMDHLDLLVDWYMGVGYRTRANFAQYPADRFEFHVIGRLISFSLVIPTDTTKSRSGGEEVVSWFRYTMQRLLDQLEQLESYRCVLMSDQNANPFILECNKRDALKVKSRLEDYKIRFLEAVFNNRCHEMEQSDLYSTYMEVVLGKNLINSSSRLQDGVMN